jgi:hypothetical protein
MAGTRKLTRRQDSAADDSPRKRLEAFMHEHAHSGANVDHHLTLIDEAIGRFERPLLEKKDIADKAKRIADAAGNLARELRNACDIRPDNDEGIIREGPGSVWPFLRIAKLIGDHGFGEDVPGALRFGEHMQQARIFDCDVGKAAALHFTIQRLEQEARAAAKTFSKRGKPRELARARFGIEMQIIWRSLSGNAPGRSGEATFETPRSYFGHFVKLVIESVNCDDERRKTIFNAILEGKKKGKSGG